MNAGVQRKKRRGSEGRKFLGIESPSSPRDEFVTLWRPDRTGIKIDKVMASVRLENGGVRSQRAQISNRRTSVA